MSGFHVYFQGTLTSRNIGTVITQIRYPVVCTLFVMAKNRFRAADIITGIAVELNLLVAPALVLVQIPPLRGQIIAKVARVADTFVLVAGVLIKHCLACGRVSTFITIVNDPLVLGFLVPFNQPGLRGREVTQVTVEFDTLVFSSDMLSEGTGRGGEMIALRASVSDALVLGLYVFGEVGFLCGGKSTLVTRISHVFVVRSYVPSQVLSSRISVGA